MKTPARSGFDLRSWRGLVLTLFVLTIAAVSPSQAGDGRALYADACASCHGMDGRGSPEGTAIDVPLPDFTDCGFNTREPDSDWSFVVNHGGTAMGLSSQMPAYADALTADEMAEVLAYMRQFCRDDRCPRGELNFRRAMFTSKAFPENEAVLVQRFSEDEDGGTAWTTQLQAEMRIGPRGQIELSVPFQIEDPNEGPTVGGIGDLALGYKHVLYANLPARTIASGSLELALPSGDRDRGLGDGTVKFEPSLHAGSAALAPIVLQG